MKMKNLVLVGAMLVAPLVTLAQKVTYDSKAASKLIEKKMQPVNVELDSAWQEKSETTFFYSRHGMEAQGQRLMRTQQFEGTEKIKTSSKMKVDQIIMQNIQGIVPDGKYKGEKDVRTFIVTDNNPTVDKSQKDGSYNDLFKINSTMDSDVMNIVAAQEKIADIEKKIQELAKRDSINKVEAAKIPVTKKPAVDPNKQFKAGSGLQKSVAKPEQKPVEKISAEQTKLKEMKKNIQDVLKTPLQNTFDATTKIHTKPQHYLDNIIVHAAKNGTDKTMQLIDSGFTRDIRNGDIGVDKWKNPAPIGPKQ